MRSRNRGAWWIAGLAVLAAIASGGPEARAGAITIKGGFVPHGDPQYIYNFDVTLNGGPGDVVYYGDSFTIDGLPGITDSAGSPSYVSSSYTFSNASIDETVTTSPYQANVTWTYQGMIPITGPEFLGTFSIYTTYNYPPGDTPLPPGTIVDYTWSIDQGNNTGNGAFTITAVPEPSSVLLLLIGAGVPAGVVIRRRLRRAR